MALQQQFSNFDSLKKWQILVYKRDDNTITYGIIVAKIKKVTEYRVYEITKYDPLVIKETNRKFCNKVEKLF